MTFENRLPANYSFGTLTGAASISDTTLTSTDFGTRLASSLSTTNYVPMTLQDPSTGNFEIVWVSAHTAAATTCTVTRGKEGTSARAWGTGTLWVTAPTLRDGVLPVATRASLPTDWHVGLRCYVIDEQLVLERTLTAWIESMAGPLVELRQTVAQSLPHNTFTSVTFTTEDIDTNTMHDTVTNPSRITVIKAGRYQLSGAIAFDINANNSRGTQWAKGGTVLPGSTINVASSGAGVYTVIPMRTKIVTLAAGEYVEAQAWQNTGGALNTIAAGENACTISVEYVGA
ncbi:MAG TPA: hypothetical protein VFX53_17135 [Pedococcus sp.]|nr:hypothetical protein [Pedococcus sp.]